MASTMDRFLHNQERSFDERSESVESHPTQMERINRRELRERLQRGEEVIIVDAHDRSAFDASNIKPKGSVRIAPGATNGEIARLPVDRLIVTV